MVWVCQMAIEILQLTSNGEGMLNGDLIFLIAIQYTSHCPMVTKF
jgi:hypothetical protein